MTIVSILVLGTFLYGCGEREPALSIESVQVVAPAPGRAASVAYMTVVNRGSTDLNLTSISSPQFKKVELHETVIKDGISRMRALTEIVVTATSQVQFKPMGKHVMLLEPVGVLAPGSSVTLNVHFDSGDILIVETALTTRLKLE